MQSQAVPSIAKESVFVKTQPVEFGDPVQGYDFNQGVDFEKLLSQYRVMGFQATTFGRAVEEVNKMLKWRLSDEPVQPDDDIKDPAERAKVRDLKRLFFRVN
jgi:deoxyhypusine synthase